MGAPQHHAGVLMPTRCDLNAAAYHIQKHVGQVKWLPWETLHGMLWLCFCP